MTDTAVPMIDTAAPMADIAVPMIDIAIPMKDIAVPNTHNLAKTITDKQNKYQELANEICAMWKQNTAQAIPIVILSTGVIPKSLSQSLKRLDLHPNTHIQMQKSVILGTCLIVRNCLNHQSDRQPNAVGY